MSKVTIGIIGSRFQADCIAHSVRMMPDEAEVVAVASPTSGNARAFAERHSLRSHYRDYRDMLCLLFELIRIARANPVALEEHIESPHDSTLFADMPPPGS